MPDVQQLAEYGRYDPSYPERIFRMAEAATTDLSRRADEALKAQIAERKRGQYGAIALAFTALIAAIVFGAFGQTLAAGLLLSVPLALLVRALIGQAGSKHDED